MKMKKHKSTADSNYPFLEHFSRFTAYSNNPLKGALRIAGIYIILGVLWILLSDRIVEILVQDKQLFTIISMVKGWLFILFSGAAIFTLVYSALKRVRVDEERLDSSYRQLSATHEELEATYEELTAQEEELRQQYETLMEHQNLLMDYQQKLTYLAYHDQLTSLSNRLALNEEKDESLISAQSINFTLMYIDIDNFKVINDTLGHNFGDQLISLFSKRLVSRLQGSGSIYRQGGDEFVVVFDHVSELQDVTEHAEHLLASVIDPFPLNDSSIYINISIGIAIYPEHGRNINELLRCADIAMYKAKENGGNCYIIYQNEMNKAITERMIIHKNLHDALDNNELELYYQPQYDIKQQKYTGIEALLRWNSRDMGLVPPLKFISIAEETHLIIPIGTWVIKKACEFIKLLHDKGLTEITVSVNVSVLQLLQNDIVETILQTLEEYHLEPQSLELEITESVLMESFDVIKDNLNVLVSKGVKIALDDFGKGYSSLNYLKLLPINTLKIDKSFIDNICQDGDSKSLLSNIIGIGRCMNLSVIAEGVETKDQLDYLAANDCDKIQGYWFSKPVPEAEIERLLMNSQFNHSIEKGVIKL